MAFDPNIRASDADRDRTVTLLREHLAAGRLDNMEFDDRMEKALAAKTLGELDLLMADLPGIDLYRLPDARLTRQPMQAQPARRHREHWRAAWGSWFTVSLVLFVIWALGGHGYVWPLWVAGPWAAILVGDWVAGSHRRGRQLGSGSGGPGQLPGPGGPGDPR